MACVEVLVSLYMQISTCPQPLNKNGGGLVAGQDNWDVGSSKW
jgi:hypothetical protein